ncbi:hypothetical protein MUK42_06440 [Musa troglodytarum]|uniref:Integrase catalytic domain-containing protein n=1 Tax=Musa troglodytarum TaxID=320322 RepID=A0A9E7GBB0_9LILI|nr:hypothetical protein MUK42_06440 [Musa troglodytarum]
MQRADIEVLALSFFFSRLSLFWDLEWIIDTGASYHATPHREFFATYKSRNFGVVKMDNHGTTDIMGMGDIHIKTNLGCKLVLKDVRHVVDLRLNLLSVGKLDDEDYNNRKVWAYALKTKDQVISVFKEFHARVERETERQLKCIRSDNGGEYIGLFDDYYMSHDIQHEMIVPGTPQHNAIVERMNRTIMEKIRCMLSQKELSESFAMKDMEPAKQILGMQISRDRKNKKIWLSHEKYIEKGHGQKCKWSINDALCDELQSTESNHK